MSSTCVCSDPDEVRLVGGTSQCNGRPELKHNDNWRALDADSTESWGRETTAIICQRLGCGSPLSVARMPFPTPSTWLINISCIVSSNLLKECVTANDIPKDSSIEISCSGKTWNDKAEWPCNASDGNSLHACVDTFWYISILLNAYVFRSNVMLDTEIIKPGRCLWLQKCVCWYCRLYDLV